MVRSKNVRSALLLIALLACQDTQLPFSPDGSPPLLSILDATHSSGNPHFLFLPPMVPEPSYGGEFDGSLSPIVQICEWSGTDCTGSLVAEFGMTTAAGSETVRIVSEDEHYIVNWHTKDFQLDAAKTYRIAVLVAGTELGHADVDVVNSGKEVKNVETDEYVPLVNGRTLPIKFRIEEGAVWVVGSTGGTVVAADGDVTLTFPEGALTREVGITVQPTVIPFPSSDIVDGTVLEFGPDGMRFEHPVLLAIRYDPAKLPPGTDPASLGLAKIVATMLQGVAARSVDPALMTVSGLVSSFSPYGIVIVPPTEEFNASNEFAAFSRARDPETNDPNRMFHTGIDDPGQRKTIVRAVADGAVVQVFGLAGDTGVETDETICLWSQGAEDQELSAGDRCIATDRPRLTNHGLGITIIIEHPTATGTQYSLYAHLDAVREDIFEAVRGNMTVPADQYRTIPVKANEAIGLMGYTRFSYRPPADADDLFHLHFELKAAPTLGDQSDKYWGYTPDRPGAYGYHDPRLAISPPPPIDREATIPLRVVGEEVASSDGVCSSIEDDRGVRIYTGPGVGYSVLGWTGGNQRLVADALATSTTPGDDFAGRRWYRIPLPNERAPIHGWIPATRRTDHAVLVEEEPSATLATLNRQITLRRSAGDGTTLTVWDNVRGDHRDVHVWEGQSFVVSESESIDGTIWHRIVIPKIYFRDPNTTQKCAPAGDPVGDNAVGDIENAWLPDDALTLNEVPAAGGTFVDRDLGIIGTAAVFDPIAFGGAVEISGPPDWNAGNPVVAGLFQPSATARNRSMWWDLITPLSGSYSAKALSTEAIQEALFSIDAVSTLNTPSITSLSFPAGGQIQITWVPDPENESCLVRVNDVPWPGFSLSDHVVSCAQQAFLFTGLPLIAGRTYQAVVFGLSSDVETPELIAAPFNVAADDIVFVASELSALASDVAVPVQSAASSTPILLPPSPPVR